MTGELTLKPLSKANSAAARARWLSDLTRAIDDAQQLAWRLGVVEGRNAQALDLYVQLEVARAEVEALQGPRPRIAPSEPHIAGQAFRAGGLDLPES